MSDNKGTGYIEDGVIADIKWGYNSKKIPVISIYQKGKFIAQIELTLHEIVTGYHFLKREIHVS